MSTEPSHRCGNKTFNLLFPRDTWVYNYQPSLLLRHVGIEPSVCMIGTECWPEDMDISYTGLGIYVDSVKTAAYRPGCLYGYVLFWKKNWQDHCQDEKRNQ